MEGGTREPRLLYARLCLSLVSPDGVAHAVRRFDPGSLPVAGEAVSPNVLQVTIPDIYRAETRAKFRETKRSHAAAPHYGKPRVGGRCSL